MKEYLDQLQHNNESSLKNLKGMTIIPLTFSPSQTFIPLYDCSVSDGFPSPADDSFTITMDLNSHLIKNAPATFFVRRSGDSMIHAEIYNGYLLVVDRSLTPKYNDIVIAAVNADLTVKRLIFVNKKTILKTENPDFSDIEMN